MRLGKAYFLKKTRAFVRLTWECDKPITYLVKGFTLDGSDNF